MLQVAFELEPIVDGGKAFDLYTRTKNTLLFMLLNIGISSDYCEFLILFKKKLHLFELSRFNQSGRRAGIPSQDNLTIEFHMTIQKNEPQRMRIPPPKAQES